MARLRRHLHYTSPFNGGPAINSDEVRVIHDGSQIGTLASSAATFSETFTLSPTIPQSFQYKLHFVNSGSVITELLDTVSLKGVGP